MKKEIQTTPEGISAAIAEIEAELKKKKVKSKLLYKAVLSTEEIISSLASTSDSLFYEIVDTPLRKQIVITSKGPKYERSDSTLNLDLEEIDDETGDYIRRIVLNSLSDRIHYGYRKNTNRIAVEFGQKKNANPIVIAILAAIIIGFAFRFFVPETVSAGLCNYVLNPISTILLSLLQLIVGPMVFFSIATSISQYSDFSDFGRVGAKVLLTYLITSVIALFVGFGTFHIFTPGVTNSFSVNGTAASEVSMSLLDSIVDIFPSNAIVSFYENNMLQIILFAILIGLSIGKMKDYREPITNLFNGFNEVVNGSMSIISKGIPLFAFSSLCSLIVSTGIDSIISVVQIILSCYGGFIIMFFIYMLLLRFVAKANPFKFFKTHSPYMMNAAAIMSSNASIPKSMEECEKLGIPKKIYSFSIPLGATINMDGMSIVNIVLALACAKMCGVTVTDPSLLLNLFFTALMLSLATPGVPGAACASEMALLSVLGLPMELLPVMISVVSLSDMGNTANNVTGDIVATLIVSAREKLLDRNKFNS